MPRKTKKAKREKGPFHDYDRYEHPAFGTVQLNRVSGQTRLFDSEFNHQHYISLKINTACMDRGLSSNWVYAKSEIVEVYMSEAQFATLISSIGQASGTPCTLKHIDRKIIPNIAPMETEQQRHVNEFDDHLKQVYAQIDRLEEEIEQARMTQKLRGTLKDRIRAIRNATNSNLKFVANSFAESMEATVEKAKQEIIGFAKNNSVAAPQLDDKKPPRIEKP